MDVAANGTNATRLAFAHRRKDVHALNQAIRTALQPSTGKTAEVMLDTDAGPRAFTAGDRIVFSRNDKELGVKNGMLGTIERAEASKVVVTLDGEPSQKVTFDPRHYRSFDHGYAVTIHKSQGATVNRSYVLASRSMDRHLAYVAMTRHRDAMHLFIRNSDRPVWSRSDREEYGRTAPLQWETRQRTGPDMG